MSDGAHSTEIGTSRQVVPATFQEELRRFLTDVVERAGGVDAVRTGLFEMGYHSDGEPYADRTIRAWTSGSRTPSADLVFALANRFQVSLDHYAFGRAIDDEIEKLRRRREVLGMPA